MTVQSAKQSKLLKFLELDIPSWVAILNFFTVACLLLGVFAANYLNVKVSVLISYMFAEQPGLGVPYDFTGKDMSGHYFGDFLQTVDWSTRQNPWTLGIANYPPLPVYLLKLISWMPYDSARLVYFLAIFLFAVLVTWFITKGLPTAARFTLSGALGLAGAPILAALDRGNNVAFVGAMFGLFVYAIVRDKKKLAVAMLVLMVSFKIYPVIFGLVFLRKKWFKEAAVSAAIVVALNTLLFAITPGGLAATFQGFWKANQTFGSIQSGFAVNAWTDALTQMGWSAPDASAFSAQWIAGLVKLLPWMAIIAAASATLLGQLSLMERLYLLAMATMFFNGAPISYNWTWAPFFIALAFVALHTRNEEEGRIGRYWLREPLLTYATVTLAVLCMPAGWHFEGTQLALLPYMGWLFGLVGVVLALAVNSARVAAKWRVSSDS